MLKYNEIRRKSPLQEHLPSRQLLTGNESDDYDEYFLGGMKS